MPRHPHFSPESDPRLFKCGCGRAECDAPAPTEALLDKLEQVRVRMGRPMLITSGPRCAFWNQHEHGEPDSEHLTGEGADVEALTSGYRFELVDSCLLSLVVRLGIGPTFVHIGVGTGREHVQQVMWVYYPKPPRAVTA